MFRIDKSLVDNMNFNKSFIIIKNKDNIKDESKEIKEVRHAQHEQTIENDTDILQKAIEKASLIVENAQSEAEDIKQAAWKEGYAQGKDEAEQRIAVQVQAQERAAMDFLRKLKVYKQNLFDEMQDSILELSMDIAEKIVNIELKRDDTVYIGIVKKAIASLKSSGKFALRVSRSEYDRYFKDESAWFENDTEHVLLETTCDPFLKDGDCIVESGQTIISAGVPLQLNKIKRLLNEDTQHG